MQLPSLTGGPFIPSAFWLLSLAVLAAGQLSMHLRPRGREAGALDAYAIAFLAGGARRYVDAVVAELQARGALVAGDDGRLLPVPTFQASPAGRALLSAHRPLTRDDADIMLALHAGRIAASLRRDGLLLDADQIRYLRLGMVLPYALVLLACVAAQRSGQLAHVPAAHVIGVLFLTIGLAALRYLRCDPRTRAGIAAVAERQRAFVPAREATPANVAMAVALFGSAAKGAAPIPVVASLPNAARCEE